MMESVLPLTEMSLPSTLIDVTPSSSIARSPFFAGVEARTTPFTTAPAGITTRSPTMTLSLMVPDQASPGCALSELMAAVTSTLSEVPAAIVTPGFSTAIGGGAALGWCGFGVWLGATACGFGFSTAGGGVTWGCRCGSWYVVCGVMLPLERSVGLLATRLSVLAGVAACSAFFWHPVEQKAAIRATPSMRD